MKIISIKFLTIAVLSTIVSWMIPQWAQADVVIYSPAGGPVFIDEASPMFDVNLDESTGDLAVDFSIEFDFGTSFTLEGAVITNIVDSDGLGNADFISAGETVGPTDATWINSVGLNNFVGQRGFMGLQFDISGNQHFGYLDFELNSDSNQLVLHGGAFESNSNTFLTAGGSSVPEPNAVFFLGLGMTIVATCRRRKKRP